MDGNFTLKMGYGEASWIFCILCIILIFWLYSVIVNRHNLKKSYEKEGISEHKTAKNIKQSYNKEYL